MAIDFPNIDPIILQLGPLAISWYSLSYVGGILLGWLYIRHLDNIGRVHFPTNLIDDLIIWSILGIIIGGRLGYVIFYNLPFYIQNPLEIVKTWEGGMSFHGGLVGLIVSTYFLAKKYNVKFLQLLDVFACAAPIGLFLGRIANFINGNLYGKVTNVSWAIIFPHGGNAPRHPSQLYEAFFEGLVILFILFVLFSFTRMQKYRGMLSGVFLILYSCFRFIIEYFREPDVHLGYIYESFSMGQILSLPMVLFGLILVIVSIKLYKPAQTSKKIPV